MDKQIIVDYLGGKPARVAKRLGYKGVQMVYNWPKQISSPLLDAIILRMQAKRIKVPEWWAAKE